MMPLANIAPLLERMKTAQKASPVAASNIVLLAASKAQPENAIEDAIKSGVTVFGENRVQEAQTKWPEIKKHHPHVALHLIGPLQTNKVRDALALFDVIQTLDRPKLAEALSREIEKSNPRILESSSPRFFIQVNTGKELQKTGISPEEADAFIEYCRNMLRLPVTGLMCVPPHDQPPAPHFALLREIALRHGLKELSMGMSEDFETAIRMGATCVRLGRAIFGKRH